MKMKKRALVSVSDKTGVVDFCKGLVKNGFEIKIGRASCRERV